MILLCNKSYVIVYMALFDFSEVHVQKHLLIWSFWWHAFLNDTLFEDRYILVGEVGFLWSVLWSTL